MVTPLCNDLRERFLEEPDRASREPHLAGCESCRAWFERHRRLVGALGSLERFVAPEELETRVAATLGRTRIESALASLPRPTAPSVLERLVAEELADPAAQRARRFVGDLPGHEAPEGLDLRLVEPLPDRTAPRLAPVLRVVSGLLAAAAVVAWVLLALPERAAETDAAVQTALRNDLGAGRRFRVRRMTSAAELDPLAAQLVHGLTGIAPKSLADSTSDGRPTDGPDDGTEAVR